MKFNLECKRNTELDSAWCLKTLGNLHFHNTQFNHWRAESEVEKAWKCALDKKVVCHKYNVIITCYSAMVSVHTSRTDQFNAPYKLITF